MSKQDFIEHTQKTVGMFSSLEMHLAANFYPPMPSAVKKVFLDAFNQYWAGQIGITGLQTELSRVYTGSLYAYGFDNYLLEEDLEEEY